MAPIVPFIPAIIGAVGVGVSVVGQRRAAKEARSAREMQATAIAREGVQREEVARTRLKKLLASQRALYAKAGVDLSTGSPLTVLADTAARGEQEALNIRRGATEGAGITRFQGAAEARAGRTRATGTLLAGLATTGGSAFKTFQAQKGTV
ncbi:MAG: hypothetical protein KAJ10_03560 [Thermodesulfovibrionia bacterium]|nr:hypothetical protein [Thermodesulfovibrionia bacterium]